MSAYYLEFLKEAHARLRPRNYFEIGIREGRSLSLAKCPSVGVDPNFKITHALSGQYHLATRTSDSYFELLNRNEEKIFLPIDMAFIDGMHLSEFALRDLLNTLRFSHPHTVIFLDDMLPLDPEQAARKQTTEIWAGDVWKVARYIQTKMPSLECKFIDTRVTGLMMIVVGENTGPQNMPSETEMAALIDMEFDDEWRRKIFERSQAESPDALLESGFFEDIARKREAH